MRPRRVKVDGDLFHGRVPDGAIYVGRQTPGLVESLFANPHRVNKPCPVPGCARVPHSRGAAVVAYKRHLRGNPELVERIRTELAGKDLACWCPVDEPCHADLLLAVARGEQPWA